MCCGGTASTRWRRAADLVFQGRFRTLGSGPVKLSRCSRDRQHGGSPAAVWGGRGFSLTSMRVPRSGPTWPTAQRHSSQGVKKILGLTAALFFGSRLGLLGRIASRADRKSGLLARPDLGGRIRRPELWAGSYSLRLLCLSGPEKEESFTTSSEKLPITLLTITSPCFLSFIELVTEVDQCLLIAFPTSCKLCPLTTEPKSRAGPCSQHLEQRMAQSTYSLNA